MKDHLEHPSSATTRSIDHDDEGVDPVDDSRRRRGHDGRPSSSRRDIRAQERAGRRRRGRRADQAAAGDVPRGKPSVLRRLVVIVLALAVIGGGVGVAYKVLAPVVEGFLESNDYPGPGTGEVRVTIDQGAGGTAIAKTLADQDVVKSSKAFIEAANNDPKSAGIQPGIYTMKKQMKASDALALLVDPKNRLITRVVIPEGLWASEIYAKLSKSSGIPVARVRRGGQAGRRSSACRRRPRGTSRATSSRPATSSAPPRRPSTSSSRWSPSRRSGSRRSASRPTAWSASSRSRASSRGRPRTRPTASKVARVVENRLAAKMSLGFDSTVNYIFKKRGVPDPGHARQRQPLQHAPLPRTAARPDLQPGRERARGRRRTRSPARGSTS